MLQVPGHATRQNRWGVPSTTSNNPCGLVSHDGCHLSSLLMSSADEPGQCRLTGSGVKYSDAVCDGLDLVRAYSAVEAKDINDTSRAKALATMVLWL